jgi:hypothetical protein
MLEISCFIICVCSVAAIVSGTLAMTDTEIIAQTGQEVVEVETEAVLLSAGETGSQVHIIFYFSYYNKKIHKFYYKCHLYYNN